MAVLNFTKMTPVGFTTEPPSIKGADAPSLEQSSFQASNARIDTDSLRESAAMMRAANTSASREVPSVPSQTLSKDQILTLTDEMVERVWNSVKTETIIFHGTAVTDVGTLREKGISKESGMLNLEEAQRFCGIYRAVNDSEFSLASHVQSDKTFVSAERHVSEGYAHGSQWGGEFARRVFETIPTLIDNPNLASADMQWLKMIESRISDFSANSKPVVVGILGSVLEHLHPDEAPNGWKGKSYIALSMYQALRLEPQLTYETFLDIFRSHNSEITVTKVPSDSISDIQFVEPRKRPS